MTSGAQTLVVLMNGDRIGTLVRSGDRRFRFLYDQDLKADQTPLSVQMPVSARRYREATLGRWIAGLFPDRPELLRQWRRAFGVRGESEFDLLLHVGEDVAGAAQFVLPDRVDQVMEQEGELRTLTQANVEEMLRLTLGSRSVTIGHASEGKFSLAGAQAKVALRMQDGVWADPSGSTPSTHIIKPGIAGLPDQEFVEDVTMRLAAQIGLNVAATSVQNFGQIRALVVERFDRVRFRAKIQRIHQEDIGQALGISPLRKYESEGGPNAGTVASLIERCSTDSEADNRRFVQALIFNWLTGGTDAHARNYSLMLHRASVRLAPLYDLNSYLAFSDSPDQKLSMSVGGKFHSADIRRRDWRESASELRVGMKWIEGEIDRQLVELEPALESVVRQLGDGHQNSAAVQRMAENLIRYLATVR